MKRLAVALAALSLIGCADDPPRETHPAPIESVAPAPAPDSSEEPAAGAIRIKGPKRDDSSTTTSSASAEIDRAANEERIRKLTLAAQTRDPQPSPQPIAIDEPAPAGSRLERLRAQVARSLDKEATTRTLILAELDALARSFTGSRAWSEAREEIDTALVIDPTSATLKSSYRELTAHAEPTSRAVAPSTAKASREVHEACADILADEVVRIRAYRDRAQALATLLHDAFPEQTRALARSGWAWFEPYLQVFTDGDFQKLAQGWELENGNWIDPTQVAALNKEHASWDSPWTFSDDVHEIQTTLPLRMGHRIAIETRNLTQFLLATFRGPLDLRLPQGKLPVIVTETIADYQARMTAVVGVRTGNRMGASSAGCYMDRPWFPLCPCFLALEASGGSLTGLLRTLRHELTHQLLFECLRWKVDTTSSKRTHLWVSEGLAEVLAAHVYERGTLRLSKNPQVARGLAYVAKSSSSLPPIVDFCSKVKRGMLTADEYCIAGAVSFFFLIGEGSKYRERYLKLVELVHSEQDPPEAFDTTLQPYDADTLEREWKSFIALIKVTPG